MQKQFCYTLESNLPSVALVLIYSPARYPLLPLLSSKLTRRWGRRRGKKEEVGQDGGGRGQRWEGEEAGEGRGRRWWERTEVGGRGRWGEGENEVGEDRGGR